MSKKNSSSWADQVEINENIQRKGIELLFNAQPHPELQSKLRMMGFRPGKRPGLWYSETTAETRDFANKVKIGLAQKPEGPDLFPVATYEATKANLEKKNYSCVMITLDGEEIKNYIVFEPSKPKAEILASNFARIEFGKKFQSLVVKPKMQIREARMLFEEGKIIPVAIHQFKEKSEDRKPVLPEQEQPERKQDAKIPLEEILISTSDSEWVQGYQPEKFGSWAQADEYVRNLIGKASDAYYKINWEDGQSISGAVDLEPKDHYEGKDQIFSSHVRLFYTNLSRHIPDVLYGKKAVELAKRLVSDYQLSDEQTSLPEKNESKPEIKRGGKFEAAMALHEFNRHWSSELEKKESYPTREEFDLWFKEKYPHISKEILEDLWSSLQDTVRTLKKLKRAEGGKHRMQPYSSIYSKLLKVIPNLIEFLELGVLHGKSKLDSDAMMDLNFDYLNKDKDGNYIIALSHYYKQNGDLVPDPDMQIRVMPEMEAAEALTFQDNMRFQQVYGERDGKQTVNLHLKKDLNSFLNRWLSNLIGQGHKIDLSKSTEEDREDSSEEDYETKAYELLQKIIPDIESLLNGMEPDHQQTFDKSFPEKRLWLNLEKKEGRTASFLIIQYSSNGEEEVQYDGDIDADKKTALASFEWLDDPHAERYGRDETEEEIDERDGHIGEEIERAFTEFLEDLVDKGYRIETSEKKGNQQEEKKEDSSEEDYETKAYELLQKVIPDVESILDRLKAGQEETFERDFPEKRLWFSLKKEEGRVATLMIIQSSSDGDEEVQYDVDLDSDKKTAHATSEWLDDPHAERYERDETEEEIDERDGHIGEEIERAFTEFLEDLVDKGYQIGTGEKKDNGREEKINEKQEENKNTNEGTNRYNYTAKGVTGNIEFNPLIMASYIMEGKENLLYSMYGSRFDRAHLKGNSFTEEEILFLKSLFIEYLLGKEAPELLYQDLYEAEKDKVYFLHVETFSKEISEKNEREKNGWSCTLSQRQEIKKEYLELGLIPRMTGKKAFEKNVPVIELVNRYDEIYVEFEEKIQKPCEKEIARLNKSIKALKEKNSKQAKADIKKIKDEITGQENKVTAALRIVEDETIVFQDEVWDEVRNRALKLGYKLDDPSLDIISFRDEVMQGLFDNRMMESYHTEPVQRMAEIFIKEFFNPQKREPAETNEEVKFEGISGSIEFNPLAMARLIKDDLFFLMQFTKLFSQDALKSNSFSGEEIQEMRQLFKDYVLEDAIAEENYKKLFNEVKDKEYSELRYTRYSSAFLDLLRQELISKSSSLKSNAMSRLSAKNSEDERNKQIALADSYYMLANVHNDHLQQSINDNEIPLEFLKKVRGELNGELSYVEPPWRKSVAQNDASPDIAVLTDITGTDLSIPAVLIPAHAREPFASHQFVADEIRMGDFKDLKELSDETLDQASPAQLFEILQLSHPNEFGIPVSRMKLLEYFEEKGEEIFRKIGYPTNLDYPYVNVHSGYESVETLNDIINDHGDKGTWWSAAQDWRPVGDFERAISFIDEQIKKEKKEKEELKNPKTGKPRTKDKHLAKDIDFTIENYKESKQVIKDFIKDNPRWKENQFQGETVKTSLTNDSGVYTKETAGENLEIITIPIPKGAQCDAEIEIAKTESGQYCYGINAAKKFGDLHRGGFAPSKNSTMYADRNTALKEALTRIRKKFTDDSKKADSILSNEEVKNKRMKMALEAVEKFAGEQGISLEPENKNKQPTEILEGLASAYWQAADEEHPANKISIDAIDYNQARLRAALLKKFTQRPIDKQLFIAQKTGEIFAERNPLSTYEKSLKSSAKGDKAKSIALQAWLDDIILDHDVMSKKPGGVLKFLIGELFPDSDKLVDLPQEKVSVKAPTLKATKKQKNQHEINKEIEELIDKKDKSGASFSEDEKIFISQYTGSGGLMKQGASGRGVLYEYYTPDEIVRIMWGLAKKFGYQKGRILEPACGTGNFLKYAPKDQIVIGFETNHYSARVAQVLYPNFHIYEKAFESMFFAGNVHLKDDFSIIPYDLIIGNPPYGEFTGKYAGMGEKKWTGASEYDQYFMLRCLDLLDKNGLLVFIIPSLFLESKEKYNKVKEKILNKADVLDIYRLPENIFKTTDIGTDIIVLRKK